MKIENDRIIECTENELRKVWIEMWSEIFSYDDFKIIFMRSGAKIIQDKEG